MISGRVAEDLKANINIAISVADGVWNSLDVSIRTRVIQAGTEPLVGMTLLLNHRITIDAVPDGPVTITPIGG